jgi:hypothetical protein
MTTDRTAAPEGAGPFETAGAGTAPSRGGPPWRAIAGAIGVLLIVAIVAAALLMTRGETGTGTAPSGSAVASPSLSGDPSTSVTPHPTQSPTGSASAEPSGSTPPGPIGRWAAAATFGSEGWAEEVRDLTYAAGHFIAIGYREPDGGRGQVGPPTDEPLIWISTDGASWSRLELGAEFDGAHLASVVALPDGSAAIYGAISADDFSSATGGAWTSSNASDWTSVAIDQPEPTVLGRVADGGRGLLTLVRSNSQDGHQLWHSTDGLTWTSVRTIPDEDGTRRLNVVDYAAGPEGFVVTGYRSPLGGGVDGATAFVLASADGDEWFEADPLLTPSPYHQRVAPVNGDWIVAASAVDPAVTTWFSANGLDWEPRGQLEIPIPESEFEEASATLGTLVSTGERVMASGAGVICCHGPWWAAGVWSSFDGGTWERLGFPDGTVVSAAAAHDGTIVLAGFDRARPQDEFKARAAFWVGVGD